jgi:putative addiction module killer protein
LIEIRQTLTFARWFAGLADKRARARVLVRIRRLGLGNPGDLRPVRESVLELRIHYGPGYRVYLVRRGAGLMVLLTGGTKRMQERDIRVAVKLARNL